MAIASRLLALGRAQDVLTRVDAISAPISEVVTNSLAAHRGAIDRFDVSGPDVELTAQQALGLALALHELSTNAVKYGALSLPQGRVAVSWTIGAERAFRFEWREIGGPAVEQPVHTGFGSRLLTRIVGDYFAGEAKVEYEPAGLIYLVVGTAGEYPSS